MPTGSHGIIYVASGDSFIEEACRSATSVKAHMPDVPITLFTHQAVEHEALDEVKIDEALFDTEAAKRLKVECLQRTPYSRTLFLDTDTYVCDDVSELFTLLDGFDLAAAHAPNRLYFDKGDYPSNLPESFPEFNTGVLVYDSDKPAVQNLLEDWVTCYEEMRELGADRDQISFREELYRSSAAFTTLTPEYNCRFSFPVYLQGSAKILHAHHSNFEFAEAVLNSESHRRTLQPWMTTASLWDRLLGFYRHLRRDLRVFLLRWSNGYNR